MTLLTELLRTDVPMLPTLAAVQIWLHLGWGVVLAWLGAGITSRMSSRKGVQLGVAVVFAVAAGFPGPWAPVHWLGLAFQAPSVLTVLLCATGLGRLFRGRTQRMVPGARFPWLLTGAGMLLGWLLLLDTFALLPWQWYATGSSVLAPGVLVCVALAPWALRRRAKGWSWHTVCVVSAVLLFVAVRLPSGNLWDAVLDPWLWLALHVSVVLHWKRQRGTM